MPTRVVRIAFLGSGTVNQALHALLARRHEALVREHGVECIVTGVASRRLGWRASRTGFEGLATAPLAAASLDPAGVECADVRAWLTASTPDVVFEAIPLDPGAGQPALDYLRAALEHGAHAVSANKGPVVYGYRELSELAVVRGLGYRFESAVMDGAPVFSLARACLPLAGVTAVRGVFTSTATVVLEAVERGLTIAEGVAEAQRLGIAEADPSYDVDGWDTAVKLCAVGNVVLGADLRPRDVARDGIGALAGDEVRRAAGEGRPIRLVGEVERDRSGDVRARVAPVRCAPDGPLGVVRGATLVMHYEADAFPGGLTVRSRDPDPTTTAYGMLADLIDVLG
jgi:homoserine dehydrogenase